jgi:hypothetical protein
MGYNGISYNNHSEEGMMKNTECVVLVGAEQVAYGRLAAIKAALKMEKVGLKTRGGALRPKIAAEFGLKPRASYDVYIAEIQKRMDAALTKRQTALADAAMQEKECSGATEH